MRDASFAALAALTLVLASPAEARRGAHRRPHCPRGTVALEGSCTLRGDLALRKTLDVPSGVRLDCRGHRIVPAAEPPLVAVVVHDAAGVTITNCRIEDFEQGIYVLRTRGGNAIVGNTIAVRVKGITLWGAEDTLVEGNTVTVRSNFGAGIGAWRGSHRNLIRGNTVSALGGEPDEAAPVDFPGAYMSYSPPGAAPGAGIIVSAAGLDNPIVQFSLDGTLFQFPLLPDRAGVTANRVEDNTVSATGLTAVNLASGNRGTVVARNAVTAAGDATRRSKGINVGPGGKSAVLVPSTCVLQPWRYCVQDLDCNGRLACDPPADRCDPAPTQPVDVDLRSREVVVEDNQVEGGGLSTGIDAGAAGMAITGNRVTGAATAGLNVGRAALGSETWVELNVLAASRVGLNLSKPDAGAVVGLGFTHNDVTGSPEPIRAPVDFGVELELSSHGEGNFWDRACPDAFPGAPTPLIHDSFPYGTPVAEPAGDTPAPCAGSTP